MRISIILGSLCFILVGCASGNGNFECSKNCSYDDRVFNLMYQHVGELEACFPESAISKAPPDLAEIRIDNTGVVKNISLFNESNHQRIRYTGPGTDCIKNILSHLIWPTNGTELFQNFTTEIVYSIKQYPFYVFGQIKRVTLPNGPLIEYLTDDERHRVLRKVNGTATGGFVYNELANSWANSIKLAPSNLTLSTLPRGIVPIT